MATTMHPCTTIGTNEDSKLMADESQEIQYQVDKWIQDNIVSAKDVYDQSSYGLKHVLQEETGIYLTNNQFKDAMYLAGWVPVDDEEDNWRFYINLKRYAQLNPNSFYQWAKRYRESFHTCFSDFIDDMLQDPNFPKTADHNTILAYLKRNHACPESIESFEGLWNHWTHETLDG